MVKGLLSVLYFSLTIGTLNLKKILKKEREKFTKCCQIYSVYIVLKTKQKMFIS